MGRLSELIQEAGPRCHVVLSSSWRTDFGRFSFFVFPRKSQKSRKIWRIFFLGGNSRRTGESRGFSLSFLGASVPFLQRLCCRKKQHLKRRQKLEQDLSEALGRYFTFHDVTQLTPELHAGDRLQAIRRAQRTTPLFLARWCPLMLFSVHPSN